MCRLMRDEERGYTSVTLIAKRILVTKVTHLYWQACSNFFIYVAHLIVVGKYGKSHCNPSFGCAKATQIIEFFYHSHIKCDTSSSNNMCFWSNNSKTNHSED